MSQVQAVPLTPHRSDRDLHEQHALVRSFVPEGISQLPNGHGNRSASVPTRSLARPGGAHTVSMDSPHGPPAMDAPACHGADEAVRNLE